MSASWITTADLRTYALNGKAADESMLTDAVAGACGKVVDLCGPVITETVTDERVRVSGAREACLKWRASALSALSVFSSGLALTPSDWWVEGQVLSRRDGSKIPSDLLVTYTSGRVAAAADVAVNAVWARDAALIVAAQYVRARLARNPADPVPVGFLVPNQAQELMASHLLAPLGFA